MNLADECKLSFYDELCILHENDKTKLILVKCSLDNKVYIKKIVKSYNKEVYTVLKDDPHRNIVKIYDILEKDDELIIIEEFVNGRDLEEVLSSNEINSEDKVRGFIIQLCNALQHMHKLDIPIIHRDVKPSNIMLTNDGTIKLIDFDASRTFKEGENKIKDTVLLGTAGFAPPEQYGFAQTDCRSDIYAVGILINYLLIGKHPNEELYSGKLTKVIKKCTNLIQSERYSSVKDLIKDIDNKPFKVGERNSISWAIPGFRSKSLWKMILGVIGYMFLFSCAFTLTSDGRAYTITEKMAFLFSMLSIVALFSNYKNISNYLPMVKSKNYFVKVLGYIIFSFSFIFLWLSIEMFINGLLDLFI